MTTPGKIRVLCVDDNKDLCGMLHRLIGLQPDMTSVGMLESADRLVEEAARHSADVVIVDLSMAGRDSLEAIRDLRAAAPACRAIVYSGWDDPATEASAKAAGAADLVAKHDEPRAIVHAIRRVMGR